MMIRSTDSQIVAFMALTCACAVTIIFSFLCSLRSAINANQISIGPYSGDIFQESRSLSFKLEHRKIDTHKCVKKIPALFFQTQKDEIVQGNSSSILYHNIEICCAGYIRSHYDWNLCIPDCSSISPDNCRNGFCREPDQCECYPEFVRNSYGSCVHTCPIACENGTCYLNGTCDCTIGYILDERTRKFCRPDCNGLCGAFQECVQPGKCACQKGYQETMDLGCQPICTPDCGYGKCVGPNRCECFPGYMKRPNRNVCEADCNINCENGFCESLYRCQCREGYAYDPNTTSCLPTCGDACDNGVCIAPGICRCFDGYQLISGHCEPVCEGGCGSNGICIEPQQCACGLAQQYCTHGDCSPSGKCLCPTELTYFIDKCIRARNLENEVATFNSRVYYNKQLKREFDEQIGRFFT